MLDTLRKVVKSISPNGHSNGALKKEELLALFEKEIFSKYLFPLAYDHKTGYYFLEDGYVGIIFRLTPLIYPGEDVCKTLWTNFYKDPMLPEKSIIQWIVFANPHIEPWLDSWQNMKEKGDFYIFAEKYRNFLLQKRKEGFYTDWPCLLKRLMLFLAVKIPMRDFTEFERKTEELTAYKTSLESTLHLTGLHPVSLGPEELLYYLRTIFHPHRDYYEIMDHTRYVPELEIKHQVLDNDFYLRQEAGIIEMCGYYGKTLSIKKGNRGFPKEASLGDIFEFIG